MNNPVILLVEDDENDVFFMQRALQKASVTIPLHVVRDGQEAIDYLSGTGKFADRVQYPLPFLVFLDLKLPYVHGFGVLEWLRQQPHFRNLTVMILTSSPEDRDRQRAEELGAQAYLIKPPSAEMILKALKGTSAATLGAGA